MTTTRQRDLRPNPDGHYRPRVGRTQDGKEVKFCLGSDKAGAEAKYAQIRQLYEENCQSLYTVAQRCKLAQLGQEPTYYWTEPH